MRLVSVFAALAFLAAAQPALAQGTADQAQGETRKDKKEDRKENRADKKDDRKENKADRKEDRKENKEDRKADRKD